MDKLRHERTNLETIIASEINIRAMKSRTSLFFPLLITRLCRRAKVHTNARNYIEEYTSSSIHIRKIEAKYFNDLAKKNIGSPRQWIHYGSMRTMPIFQASKYK